MDAGLTYLSGMLTVFLAALFLHAAWHKAQAFWETTGFVADYGLLAPGHVVQATRALIAAEGLCVLALALPASRSLGALIAAALLGLYALAMALALRAGRRRLDCGCGGAPQPVSGLLVGRNLVLAALALGLAYLPAQPMGGWRAALVTIGLGLTLAALYAAADRILANSGHMRLAADRERNGIWN